jgi:uncharacterized protein with HEPN domain
MVLGEAVSQLSEDLKLRFSELPWRQPARLRNRIVHGYWDIDITILHQTATTTLPGFKDELRRIREILSRSQLP